jgi:hypothetical protein
MVPVDLSLLELAPVSFANEKWVAAGKPCLRQSCGHPHVDHIPGEAIECNQCDCLKFVGLADPDDCRCNRHHRLQRSERAESDRVNAAIVGLVIADALALLSAEHSAVVRRSYCPGWSTAQVAESTLTSRLPSAVRTPQAQPTFSW